MERLTSTAQTKSREKAVEMSIGCMQLLLIPVQFLSVTALCMFIMQRTNHRICTSKYSRQDYTYISTASRHLHWAALVEMIRKIRRYSILTCLFTTFCHSTDSFLLSLFLIVFCLSVCLSVYPSMFFPPWSIPGFFFHSLPIFLFNHLPYKGDMSNH